MLLENSIKILEAFIAKATDDACRHQYLFAPEIIAVAHFLQSAPSGRLLSLPRVETGKKPCLAFLLHLSLCHMLQFE